MKKVKKSHKQKPEEDARRFRKQQNGKQDPREDRAFRKRPIRYFLEEEE